MIEKECVDVKEAGKQILKLIGEMDKFAESFGDNTPSWKSGAMWGAAMAMNYIYAYAPKIPVIHYSMEENSDVHEEH